MNSRPIAIAPTRNVVWTSVSRTNLELELDSTSSSKPAGPRTLGAMPIIVVVVAVRLTHRTALIRIISNKQVVPIQPNNRLVLLDKIAFGFTKIIPELF